MSAGAGSYGSSYGSSFGATPFPQAPIAAAAPVAAPVVGISPSYLSGYGNGLSLGMAAFGQVGAGLGIGGLGVGGPLLNRLPVGAFGVGGIGGPAVDAVGGFGGFGGAAVPTAGYGVAGAGLAGMGVDPIGFGGAAELTGVPGGPYVPGDFGVGPLEVIGPYSLGGIYGPYGWNGLGGRAAQWGIEFGPWDYPFLRLERFEDMLEFNRRLNCLPGTAHNILCEGNNFGFNGRFP